jgi:alkanesulfonate monooxygenase SsuD/methylene tetrahydromethanopterin reductase-like flavin-dependent oxidoreductase (luciferase family)
MSDAEATATLATREFGEPSGLPLEPRLRIGVQTIHGRSKSASGPWVATIEELQAPVQLIDGCGYDSLWVGDHVAFAIPILDPLLQLAQAAVVSRRLILGTAVYLVPLRPPGPIAKMVSSLDHLTGGA